MFETCGKKELDDRDRRRPGTGCDDFDILFFLSDDLECVCQTCQSDDSGSMLVIVEDRNIGTFLELPLDLKTAGSGNILEVDASEGSGNQSNCAHKLIHILGLYAERKGIYIAERLEQDTFALHDRHTGFGTDIAQAQDSGAVRDDRTHIVSSGQFI